MTKHADLLQHHLTRSMPSNRVVTMPTRSPRRVTTRTPQQILTQLAELRRNWADDRPEDVCDVMLDELLTVRPDLRERHL